MSREHRRLMDEGSASHTARRIRSVSCSPGQRPAPAGLLLARATDALAYAERSRPARHGYPDGS